jgi:hypothetical protein
MESVIEQPMSVAPQVVVQVDGAGPEFGGRAEYGATPHFDLPKDDAERRVVECFTALQAADDKAHGAGMEFGKALIKMRAEAKHGEWLSRLDALGISRERGRHWMAKVEGKPTDRHKKAEQEAPVFDWVAALARLKQLTDEVEMLKRDKPVGSSLLHGQVEVLAEIVDYKLTKEGDNA